MKTVHINDCYKHYNVKKGVIYFIAQLPNLIPSGKQTNLTSDIFIFVMFFQQNGCHRKRVPRKKILSLRLVIFFPVSTFLHHPTPAHEKKVHWVRPTSYFCFKNVMWQFPPSYTGTWHVVLTVFLVKLGIQTIAALFMRNKVRLFQIEDYFIECGIRSGTRMDVGWIHKWIKALIGLFSIEQISVANW